MLADGLVGEVARSEKTGLSTGDMASMQGLGYKEILDYLDGEMLPGGGGLCSETGHQAFRQTAAHLVSGGKERSSGWINGSLTGRNEFWKRCWISAMRRHPPICEISNSVNTDCHDEVTSSLSSLKKIC